MEHNSLKRARKIVRQAGSRACTVRGIKRYLVAHNCDWFPVAPLCYDWEVRATNKAYGQARRLGCDSPFQAIVVNAIKEPSSKRVRLMGRRAALRRERELLTTQMRLLVLTETGCSSRDAVQIDVLGGKWSFQAPKERGDGYYFRWYGKWKHAPGSYQHSTRRITVGWEWLENSISRVWVAQ